MENVPLESILICDVVCERDRPFQLVNVALVRGKFASRGEFFLTPLNVRLQDDSYSFPGRHCLLKQGYQALVEKMASGLDVRLNQTVSRINYQGSRVKVMCDSGMSVEAGTLLSVVADMTSR